MLDAGIKAQLRDHFAKITEPVVISMALDDGDRSRELRALLTDIAGLSDKFTLTERRDGTRSAPSFSLNRAGGDIGMRFSGLPMGHEFTSLILALLQVGGHPSKLAAETIAQVRSLPGDSEHGEYRFETFVSLTCQNCPDVVQA